MKDHALADHVHHEDVAPRGEHGERRTRWVVGLTLVTMVAEIVTGQLTGSMALTADGWHMGTHAGALGLTLFAYWFARTRAGSRRFTFGTGKVHALAGFASGIFLGAVALWMAVEATSRLWEQPHVKFAEALPVAVIGLLVNLVSVWLLGGAHGHGHGHGERHGHGEHEHEREHEHEHDDHDDAGDHVHGAVAVNDHVNVNVHVEGHGHGHGHHDHNLRAAYLHVLADALTSVLAIGALVAGRYTGAWYLDPLMGVLGGIIIGRWSLGLCRDTAAQLLDVVPSADLAERIEKRLEADGAVRVADLHVWEIAPGQRGCIVSVVAAEPRAVEDYRRMILSEVRLAHLTVEVHRCVAGPCAPAA